MIELLQEYNIYFNLIHTTMHLSFNSVWVVYTLALKGLGSILFLFFRLCF